MHKVENITEVVCLLSYLQGYFLLDSLFSVVGMDIVSANGFLHEF